MSTISSGIGSYVEHFRTFSRLAKGRFLVLPILMALSSVFESVGLVLFLPLLEISNISATASSHPALRGFVRALGAIGLHSFNDVLLFIAVVFLLKFVFTFVQGVAIQHIVRSLYVTLAQRMVHGWGEANYRLSGATTTGFFTNLLDEELRAFLGAFSYYCQMLVHAIAILVTLVASFFLDARITLIAMVVGMAFLVTFRRLVTATARLSQACSAEQARFKSRLVEFIQQYKYLKATHTLHTFERHLGTHVRALAALRYRFGILNIAASTVPEPIAVLLVIAFLAVSVGVLGEPIGVVVVFILLFHRILTRVIGLQTSAQKFAGGSGALSMVLGALDRIATSREARGSVAISALRTGIAFDGVAFAYAEKSVLRDATVTFPMHATIALVGSSGAGKSTIVDLVTGLLAPQRGVVTFDGTPYDDLDLRTLRQCIGYVTQEITMFNDTIANNVSLWDDGDPVMIRARVEAACRRASCDGFITELPDRYDAMVGERGSRLSVGQRQRIAIARELYRDPPILIFDEATSALDSESEQAIQESIESLRGERTIILIAHRLSTIRHADRIYVIEDGRVVEAGTFQELSENPATRFSAMCALQTLAPT